MKKKGKVSFQFWLETYVACYILSYVLLLLFKKFTLVEIPGMMKIYPEILWDTFLIVIIIIFPYFINNQ